MTKFSKVYLIGAFAVSTFFQLIVGSSRTQAALLYTNGGYFIIGNAYNYSQFYVTNSFDLSSGATLATVDFVDLNVPGQTPTSLDWSIGTDPFGDNVASGTGTPLSLLSPPATNSFSNGQAVTDLTFSTGSVPLSANQTYYLTLFGANSVNGNAWAQSNNGPSTAFQGSGYLQDPTGPSEYGSISSDAFSLYSAPGGGTTSTAPEASSFASLALGIFGLGAISLLTARKKISSKH